MLMSSTSLFAIMITAGTLISGLYGVQVCVYIKKGYGIICPDWMNFYEFILGRLIGGIIAIIHSLLLIIFVPESPVIIYKQQDNKNLVEKSFKDIYDLYSTNQFQKAKILVF